jgi:beta-aspartyl-peptidase (threonine type)
MTRTIRVIAILFMAAATVVSASLAQAPNPQAQQAAIRKVLEAQVDAWNRHDLEGFMAGYWNSPNLTFFSGAKETQGWQATLERYRKNYQSGGAEMGKLEFSDLQIEMLGTQSAFVRGQFHLTLSNGKQPHGLFTLIFREFPEGWHIVHDHSSGE